MKIMIIGASGKIGTELSNLLETEHDIIKVGRSSGDILSDYTDADSVTSMFEQVGSFDALVAVAGHDTQFKSFNELTDEDYLYGFERKFIGQVRLLKLGMPYATDNAQFIFSSGYLTHYPNEHSIATGPFNAAIDTFASNVTPLLPRGIRVNVVSPAPIVPADRAGHGLLSARQAARKYAETLLGNKRGQVVRAWGGLETGDARREV